MTDVVEVAVGPRLGGAVPATRRRTRRRRRGSSPRGWRSGRRRCPAARSRCRARCAGSDAQAPPSEPIGHPGHRLDAAGEDQVLEAAADPRRGLVDGLQPGGAEAVELDAGDGLGVARRRARRSWRCRRPGRRPGRRRRARRRRSRSVSRLGLRSRSSSIRPTTRSTGFTSCSEPVALPLPRGVRRWSYTNACAAMTVLAVQTRGGRGRVALDCDTHYCHGRQPAATV